MQKLSDTGNSTSTSIFLTVKGHRQTEEDFNEISMVGKDRTVGSLDHKAQDSAFPCSVEV